MKIEIAKFQDGYYYVVDGVKQNKVKQEITMESFAEILCKRPNNYTKNPVPNVPRVSNTKWKNDDVPKPPTKERWAGFGL
jgi:hypothetical protein